MPDPFGADHKTLCVRSNDQGESTWICLECDWEREFYLDENGEPKTRSIEVGDPTAKHKGGQGLKGGLDMNVEDPNAHQ